MKKILLIAAAIVAVTACQKKKVDPTIGPRHTLVSFESPVLAPNTKAPISGTVLPKTCTFNVTAKQHDGDYTAWSATSDFYDGAVSYNEQAKGWSWAVNQYWPENKKLSFIAYHPSNLAEATITNAGVTITDYVATLTKGGQDDLLFSERVVDQTDNLGTFGTEYYGVQIPFHHALSQLVITAKLEQALPAEGDYVKINSITLTNVRKAATFDQGLADTDGAGVVGNAVWTIDEGTAVDNYESVVGEDPVELSTTVTADGTFEPFLVIPQAFNDALAIVVNYDKKINGAEAVTGQVKTVLVKDLLYDGVEATEYEMGKRYIYNLIFDTGVIYFAPSVSDWDDVDVTVPSIRI